MTALVLFHGLSKNLSACSPYTLSRSPSNWMRKSRPCSEVRPPPAASCAAAAAAITFNVVADALCFNPPL